MRTARCAAAVLAAVLVLTGCVSEATPGAPVAAPPSTAYPGVVTIDDLDYGGPDGVRLDVCLPGPENPGGRARPAILSVHGGGWRAGDKGQRPWRETCAWLASAGFVVFQTNYRLAPAHPFPSAVDDLTAAIEWVRQDAQVRRFGHDPARLGGFGDSAGGNLVSLLGTRPAEGASVGAPIAAVVALSAPIDLTRAGIALGDLSEGFQRVQLDYLACDSYRECPPARAASPLYHVDAADPPFLLVHATDEFIPIEQAEAFAGRLDAAGVEVTLERVDGVEHALGLLDAELRARIVDWLREHL